MAGRQLRTALQHFRSSLLPSGTALSDAHLLERWANARDEVAFELLLRRHGPMVFALCRRLLPRAQDAEDAFQATFLVLVRQASAIRKRAALGSWLYKIAYRVALRTRHRPGLPTAPVEPDCLADERPSPDAAAWRELRAVLDDEVHRLPPLYRDVFVLCHLQGKTNEEAARELGCPLGTVLSRLSRARDRLRAQLTRRGVALPATGLALVLAHHASAAPPPVLLSAVLRLAGIGAAGAPASAVVSSLYHGVVRTMFLTKIKIAASLLLAVAMTGVTGGLLAYQTHAQESDPDQPKTIVLPQDKPGQGGAAEQPLVLKQKLILKGAVAPVRALAVSPDGQRLAWGSDDGMLYLWAVPESKLINHYSSHAKGVTGVAFSKDGKTLASAGKDGVIYLRDVATGKILSRMQQDKAVSAIAFSPDGKTLAAGVADEPIQFWAVPSGKPSGKAKGAPGKVQLLSFDAAGGLLVGGAKDQGGAETQLYFIWDAKTGKPIAHTPADTRVFIFSPDGKTLASGGADGAIHIFDASTGKQKIKITAHGKSIVALAFSPDGKTLASAANDQSIRLWDLQTGKQLTQDNHQSGVSDLLISPQGKWLVTGSKDGIIKIWDIKTGKALVLDPLPAHPLPPLPVPGQPASGSLNRLVKDLVQRQKGDAECVQMLFMATLGRYPTATEAQFAQAHLSKPKVGREEALKDVLFTLTNTKEFGEHVADLQKHRAKSAADLNRLYQPYLLPGKGAAPKIDQDIHEYYIIPQGKAPAGLGSGPRIDLPPMPQAKPGELKSP